MTERHCPVAGCGRATGTTQRGDPWLMCRKHWAKLDAPQQRKLWTAFRAWQRIERQYMNQLPGIRPPALREARAIAITEYIQVRDQCIRKASEGEAEQLQVAM